MNEWTDETSYQKGEKDRTPRTWTIRAGKLRITVTRHIHFPKDAWVLRCEPFCDAHELAAKDIDSAKSEALAYIRLELDEARGSITT